MSRWRLITAEKLEEMTPYERAALVNERIVTSLIELPPHFRKKVVDTGARLLAERRASAG